MREPVVSFGAGGALSDGAGLGPNQVLPAYHPRHPGKPHPGQYVSGALHTNKPKSVQHPAIVPTVRGGWIKPRPPTPPFQQPSSSASTTILRIPTKPSFKCAISTK